MKNGLKQIVPLSACLSCDVCCRYLERSTGLVPYFLESEIKPAWLKQGNFDLVGKRPDPKPFPVPYQDHYRCSFFTPRTNSCSIYTERPLDCQLYPFMLTYGPGGQSVLLVLDSKCPFLKDKLDSPQLREYVEYLAGILEAEDMVEAINQQKNFINQFQDDCLSLKKLAHLSRRLGLGEYGLSRIALQDNALFDEYCAEIDSELSAFSFPAIYIWTSVLNILWKKIDSALCVFAGNDRDYFLLLPPIDEKFNRTAAQAALEILAQLNKNGLSTLRIENVPEQFSAGVSSLGLKLLPSSGEYLYRQKDLAQLSGDNFKAKRASCNQFTRKYKYALRPLEEKDIFNCLNLYRNWAAQKLSAEKTDYFRLLIEDSYLAQKNALMNMAHLGLEGLAVDLNGEINGYSLGYPLNKDTFVVLFETTNLETEGLAQFIFQQFTAQLSAYPYINTLSDSNLAQLKKVKDSYHPLKKIPLFSATK